MTDSTFDKVKRRLSEAKSKGSDHYQLEIESLKRSGIVPASDLQDIIKEAEREEKAQKHKDLYLDARIAEDYQEREAQERSLFAKEEDKRKEATKIYDDFRSIHSEFLGHQEAHNKDLKESLELMKNSKEISPELRGRLVKSDEEVAKHSESWKKVKKAHETAISQEKYAHENIAKIDERLNTKGGVPHEEQKLLAARKSGLTKDIEQAKEVKENCALHVEKRNKTAELLQGLSAFKDKPEFKDIYHAQAKEFKEVYGQTYQELRGELAVEKQKTVLQHVGNIHDNLQKNCSTGDNKHTKHFSAKPPEKAVKTR
jgi:hypothetical protein